MFKILSFKELTALDNLMLLNSTLEFTATCKADGTTKSCSYTLSVEEIIHDVVAGSGTHREGNITSLKLYGTDGVTYVVTSEKAENLHLDRICTANDFFAFLENILSENICHNYGFIKILLRNKLRDEIKKVGAEAIQDGFGLTPKQLDDILNDKHVFSRSLLDTMCNAFGIDTNKGIEQCEVDEASIIKIQLV